MKLLLIALLYLGTFVSIYAQIPEDHQKASLYNALNYMKFKSEEMAYLFNQKYITLNEKDRETLERTEKKAKNAYQQIRTTQNQFITNFQQTEFTTNTSIKNYKAIKKELDKNGIDALPVEGNNAELTQYFDALKNMHRVYNENSGALNKALNEIEIFMDRIGSGNIDAGGMLTPLVPVVTDGVFNAWQLYNDAAERVNKVNETFDKVKLRAYSDSGKEGVSTLDPNVEMKKK